MSAGPVFEALGNACRREILTLLAEKPLSVGAIALRMPVSRPAVSRHLRVLESAELVRRETEGTRRVYRLAPAGFANADEWLREFWAVSLARFRIIADNQAPPDE